ncbi:MAG: cell division ATP-binding protein FtsE [bacterium]
MIRFEKVSKRYRNARTALRNVSFHMQAGEMAFVTGHSGAGKSTLLRLIALLERSNGGKIHLGKLDLGSVKSKGVPWVRQRLGLVFQDHQLLNDRSIFENVALPLRLLSVSRDEENRRVRAALDLVGLLGHENDYPLMLSGGEQQRVGIARAIVHRPPVILADEPTGNLDPDLSREIMNLFIRLNQHGSTILVASHELTMIRELNQRVLVLNQGELAKDIPGGQS